MANENMVSADEALDAAIKIIGEKIVIERVQEERNKVLMAQMQAEQQADAEQKLSVVPDENAESAEQKTAQKK